MEPSSSEETEDGLLVMSAFCDCASTTGSFDGTVGYRINSEPVSRGKFPVAMLDDMGAAELRPLLPSSFETMEPPDGELLRPVSTELFGMAKLSLDSPCCCPLRDATFDDGVNENCRSYSRTRSSTMMWPS